MAKEIYSFYYLPSGKAQYTALREIKKFVNGKLSKIQKASIDLTPKMVEKSVFRFIDLLKPTFSKNGSVVQYSNVDEFTPLNDVRVLRKIYKR